MRQTPILGQALNIRAQRQEILLSLAVIPVNGRIAVPEGLIELDLAENVKGVADRKVHPVEGPEFVHTALQIIDIVGIAGPHVVEEGCDLVAVLRVDVHGIVAEAEAADRPVDFRLLAAVDQLVGAFAGDPHDVFGALRGEEEAAVRHALFQDTDVRDLAFFTVQGRTDRSDRVRPEVVGIGIQVAELLVSVDLDEIAAADYFGLQDHAVLGEAVPGLEAGRACRSIRRSRAGTGGRASVQRPLPESPVKGLIRIHPLEVVPDDARLGLGEVRDADHGVAGFFVRDRDELPLAVDADRAVLVHELADHVPGVGLRGGIGIPAAPDIAGDNVGIADPVGDQCQGVEVVPGGVIRVDDQVHAELVHQVLEIVLHKAGDDRDIFDPFFVQLTDGPLDQGLSADFDEGLGRREVDRDHAHPESGREYDRIARRPPQDLISPLHRQLPVRVDHPFRGQLLEGPVHHADAQAGRGGQDPLVDEGFKEQFFKNFRFVYVHEFSPVNLS